MNKDLRRSMAMLHGWCGVTVGWLLYAILVTGTLSYFRPEISHWMRPELRDARDQPHAIALAIRELEKRAPHSPRWLIAVSGPRDPTLRIGWTISPTPGESGSILRRFGNAQLNPVDGSELTSRQTLGGDFFRRVHFELNVKNAGRWVTGACAMFMLVSILSGVIAHRQFFRNLFAFRAGKGLRSWFDAHTAVATIALPFHLMIAYSGLVTMMLMYMPWGVEANYQEDPGGFFVDLFSNPEAHRATGMPGRLADIEPMLEQARRHWGAGAAPANISVEHPQDAGARITMDRDASGRLSNHSQSIVFDGISGELLSATAQEPVALRIYGTLLGLHTAHFSSTALRWLFVLGGLAGTLMVATGLVMWTVKRRTRDAEGDATASQRLVELINIGVIAGLPLGVASYFWANRLIPADLAGRSMWEIRCFFAALVLSCIAAPLQQRSNAWCRHFAAGAVLFGLLPIVNALTTNTHLGVTLRNGSSIYAAFDLTMIAIAAMLAAAAWYASRMNRQSQAAVTPRHI